MQVINWLLDHWVFVLSQALGILAMLTILVSFQIRRRWHLILVNALGRLLYILQYLLLGAFSGAVLDVLGLAAAVIAGKKDSPRLRRHKRLLCLGVNLSIVAVGLLLYQNIFSLFPIVGVLLHTGAFWLDQPRRIRRLSLLGSPFWFIYNLTSRAYGSAAGDLLTMGSILVAMFRYRKDGPPPESPASGS